MKKQLQVGLIVEGNSTKSAVLRLPKLGAEIGPIKSGVLRVARRLSNFLRAGYAVGTYEDLQTARIILIRVPDSAAPRIVEAICQSQLELSQLSFVLCESWLTTDVLGPLAERGASVGTVVAVPGGRRNLFVVEGQVAAVRQMRRLIELNQARAFELRPGTKHYYFAAGVMISALTTPFLQTAQQALRSCGIVGNPLSTLTDEMVQEMLRDFLKGARTNWGGPMTECSGETVAGHFEKLRGSDAQTADILEFGLAYARRTLEAKNQS